MFLTSKKIKKNKYLQYDKVVIPVCGISVAAFKMRQQPQ